MQLNNLQKAIIKFCIQEGKMMSEEEENLQKMYREFENLRKRVKNEVQDEGNEQDLFPDKQKNQLKHFLSALSEYPKITAVMIQHQHKSIQTLPKQILGKFPEFNQRVQRSIACCKKNSQFLVKIKTSLEVNLRLNSGESSKSALSVENAHNCGGEEHSHSHAVAPRKVLGIFSQLCREYSEEQIHKSQRYFMEFIKENVKEYLEQKQQKGQNLTTLVVGSGMGRILIQIKNIFKSMNLPLSSCFIQGHQEDPQFYLLAQYMLNYHDSLQSQPIQIYPYIHNFSNHTKTQTPYKAVKLPLYQKQPHPYPLTFGSFHQLYKSHSQQWSIIVTTFYNYSVTDVLMYIQLIYKLLKKGGLWVDVATASFENHMIPYLSYEEYEKILDKSQFTLVKRMSKDQLWYQEPDKLIHEWRRVHYRVMKKV